jgi:hypothetical protein
VSVCVRERERGERDRELERERERERGRDLNICGCSSVMQVQYIIISSCAELYIHSRFYCTLLCFFFRCWSKIQLNCRTLKLQMN